MNHYAYFTDVFTLDGVTISFVYTKCKGESWTVCASINAGSTFAEFYNALDDKPESLEELIASHRIAVSNIVRTWATALMPRSRND